MAPAMAGLALACASALAPAQVSLTTVVELAQQNSSAVKLANADLQKAQAALGQTEDAYIPNFVIGSQIGYSHGFPTGQPSVGNATMQSLVLSFSQRQYTKAARAGVEAANLSLKDAKEQVALDASTAYIEMDTVDSELEAAREQEQDAARLVAIEQQRTEAGVDPLSALLQAKLTAAQLKLSRLHLETRSATLAKQLATLTGLPVGSITARSRQHSRDSCRLRRRSATAPSRHSIRECPSAFQAAGGKGSRSGVAPPFDRIRRRL